MRLTILLNQSTVSPSRFYRSVVCADAPDVEGHGADLAVGFYNAHLV